MALKELLNEEIKSNLSKEESRFYGMEKQLSEKESSAGSDFTRQAFRIIQSSISGAKDASIEKLENNLSRLSSLRKYISKANLGDEEQKLLSDSINAAESALKAQLKDKKSYFSRAKKIISDNSVDIGALLIGMSANDPLMALGVKIIGDKLKSRRDKIRAAKDEKRQSVISDAEGLRDSSAQPQASSIPGVEPESAGTTDQGGQAFGGTFGGPGILNILQDIFLYTEETSKDLKLLLEIQKSSLDVEKRQVLADKENQLEQGRLKRDSGTAPGKEAKGGVISSLTNMFAPGNRGKLLAMIGKHGLILGVVGATLYGVYDIFDSYFKTGEFGNSETEKLIKSIDSELMNLISGLGPGAAGGAKAGSDVIPLVGTLVGGLLGVFMGSLTNWFGNSMPDLGAANPFQAAIFGIYDVVMSAINGMFKSIFNKIETAIGYLPFGKETAMEQLNKVKDLVLGATEPSSASITNTQQEAVEKQFVKKQEELDSQYRTGTGVFEETTDAEGTYSAQKALLDAQKRKAMKIALSMDVKAIQRKTTTPTIEDAKNAVSYSGLGSVSTKYETGGRGAGVISSGSGDAGGKSYGTYQLSSTRGQVDAFLDTTGYREKFPGMKVGTTEFDEKWKELAATDPNFSEAQHHYITKTHYEPQIAKLKKSGIDLSGKGPAVQEAVFSTSVQYGPNSSQITRALEGKDVSAMSDNEIVSAIQDYKAANVDSNFRSSDANVRAGVAKRIQNEKRDLLALAAASPSSTGARIEQAQNQVRMAEAVAPNINVNVQQNTMASASGQQRTPPPMSQGTDTSKGSATTAQMSRA